MRGMTSKSDELEEELRRNLKLRRELQGEIAKAEVDGQVLQSRSLRDWFLTRWLDFWKEDRRRYRSATRQKKRHQDGPPEAVSLLLMPIGVPLVSKKATTPRIKFLALSRLSQRAAFFQLSQPSD